MPQQILAGHYQIIQPLSSGGFGQTFLAQDSHLPGSPLCVVKQLKPQYQDPDTLAVAHLLFQREAEKLHDLGCHDQIPRLLAHFEQDGEFYLVQEFIQGDPLDHQIFPGQMLAEPEVIQLLGDVLEILEFVHQKHLIHRDLKPANLIRRWDQKLVLIDFGAVKEIRHRKATPPGQSTITMAIGTPGYMPSEQSAGNPHCSSDIYAVGMIGLQALTGISPLQLTDLRQGQPASEITCALLDLSVGVGLATILDRMVRYDYRQRYQDATEALNAIRHLQSCQGPTIVTSSSLPTLLKLDEPEGQVSLTSQFYIERPPVETDCYDTILKPGALIRIKAPRQMGKSSLMSRILHYAKTQGCKTVAINFQSADGDYLKTLDQFLQWFAASVTDELNLTARSNPENTLKTYWNGVLGSKNKCTNYFQRYLLPKIGGPLVLGLDEVDQIFQYPTIAAEFFALLRFWHETAKNADMWKQLRLVIVHSKEVYIPLNINQSPFNVGLPIELPELSQSQVWDLVQRHSLTWSEAQVTQLMDLVGGHPYLVRQALYQIARGRMTLAALLREAPTEAGIYGDHLHRHLLNLQEDGELTAAFRQVIHQNGPVRIDPSKAFKLRSMGLVKPQGNEVMPLCGLYQIYFADRLGQG
ncbi:serine/threonine protein kinase [Leptolyngbya sp. 'hensonii']|uniref:AAA-like domain-containing protein n=1 Tax=Leptolyngbya sp. 'hensonii' TaxID=1922337 RepID=UPI00094FE5EA|nr:AAA-like domain-containing protein [Leptolyngbya sp. 'hensonii']OLP19103.1 serine/threonine protein kinase [Leptolyngbya sp. 'hensonii']